MNSSQRRKHRRATGDESGIMKTGLKLVTAVGVKRFPRCPDCNAEIREKMHKYGQWNYVCLQGHFGNWMERKA